MVSTLKVVFYNKNNNSVIVSLSLEQSQIVPHFLRPKRKRTRTVTETDSKMEKLPEKVRFDNCTYDNLKQTFSAKFA